MACRDLYAEICSFRNLDLAYRKARKGKSSRRDVQDFGLLLEENLLLLRRELCDFSYVPSPMRRFVVRDPKTRVIHASAFRDRVVHHALCNVIQPMLERSFISDSYANRIGKGTGKALERFDAFKRKVSGNGRPVNSAKDASMVIGYVLKADIRHFFGTVDHEVLMRIIRRKIPDGRVLSLIRKILKNHEGAEPGKGMPLGNLTSQFFANLYLDGLDHFVKEELRAKRYIRYVDDFVILDESNERLERFRVGIEEFLEKELVLGLHPEKTQVRPLHNGTNLLGFRVFYYHRLLRRANVAKMRKRMDLHPGRHAGCGAARHGAMQSLEGWLAYAKQGNTYGLRKRIAAEFNAGMPSAASRK